MLYLRLDSATSETSKAKLEYHCKHCTLSFDADDSTESSCIIGNNYTDDLHKQYMTDNIIYDRTLPRTDAIPCANSKCSRPAEKPQEVIYVKYDPTNMKFLYHCCHCRHFWRSQSL
jgi:hypothetical protein